VRSASSSTSRSAMSMPLETPADVMILLSRCSTTRVVEYAALRQ
jgi:hypothetical protein